VRTRIRSRSAGRLPAACRKTTHRSGRRGEQARGVADRAGTPTATGEAPTASRTTTGASPPIGRRRQASPGGTGLSAPPTARIPGDPARLGARDYADPGGDHGSRQGGDPAAARLRVTMGVPRRIRRAEAVYPLPSDPGFGKGPGHPGMQVRNLTPLRVPTPLGVLLQVRSPDAGGVLVQLRSPDADSEPYRASAS
jgi:hypothetical protein